MPSIKTRPVQSTEWERAIRDYEFDITLGEYAVGSMAGTSGNFGQDTYISDLAMSDIFMSDRKGHVDRHTIGKYRAKLISKGLMEDFGPLPWNAKKHHYGLCLPIDMPKRRRDESDGASDAIDPMRSHTSSDVLSGDTGINPMVRHTPSDGMSDTIQDNPMVRETNSDGVSDTITASNTSTSQSIKTMTDGTEGLDGLCPVETEIETNKTETDGTSSVTQRTEVPLLVSLDVPGSTIPRVHEVPRASLDSSVIPSVPAQLRKEKEEKMVSAPRPGSMRARKLSSVSVWSAEEIQELTDTLGVDELGRPFESWLDEIVSSGDLDKDDPEDMKFFWDWAKSCSSKKPSPAGFFRVSLIDRLNASKTGKTQNAVQTAPESTLPGVETVPGLPGYVKGDLVSHAITEALMGKFESEGIVLNQKPAWVFWEVQSALVGIKLAENYDKKGDTFKDGNGDKLSLEEFGRRLVNYFWKNAAWSDCSSGQAVVAMFTDPVNLKHSIKGLKQVYAGRRAKNGVN